jgi:hypothetical protein
MKKPATHQAMFRIRKLFHQYANSVDYHRWPDENHRWNELLLSLLLTISDKHQNYIRNIIEELSTLGLLNVDELVALPSVNGKVDTDSDHALKIAETLKEYEFTDEECEDSILIMHEAAKSLKERHNGKVQRYLRKYGQLMLDQLNKDFSFSKMNQTDVKNAFTFWLQNVMNMPISLEDEHIIEFCNKFGISPKELTDFADEIDLNVAVLDDLIKNWDFSLRVREAGHPRKTS